MQKFIVFGLLWVLVLSGCGMFEPKQEESAQELAHNGMEAFEDNNFRKTIEYFEKLKDWYPFSKFAILAELKIADSYYHLGEYEEAIGAYEEFENLHPRNEAIPHVLYHLARCYFEQIETKDRSQIATQNALDVFQRLLTQFPDNAFAPKSREHIRRCLENLAGHDFTVGQYYFKKKHYRAALGRFKNVLTKYPDVGLHQEALKYIARCEERMAGKNNKKKK